MNDRIKELVDVVAERMPEVYTIKYENGEKGIEFNEEAFEKFSELLVQKCCALAYEAEQADVPVIASKFIKAHFGVK